MIRSELVQKIADDYPHISHRDALKAVDAIFGELTSAMERSQRIELRGFGAFTVKHRPARKGRNPSTGEPVSVEETYVPFFKMGKLIFDRINGKA